MGCTLNAFTQYDITAYMTVCGAHHLELMMYLSAHHEHRPRRHAGMVDTEPRSSATNSDADRELHPDVHGLGVRQQAHVLR